MLDPVSVEITYGIERIVMALQGVDHFKNIAYAPGISYGEVFGQSEYEMSRYYLDDADIEANQRLFGEYADEADRMLALRLPVPAYVSHPQVRATRSTCWTHAARSAPPNARRPSPGCAI